MSSLEDIPAKHTASEITAVDSDVQQCFAYDCFSRCFAHLSSYYHQRRASKEQETQTDKVAVMNPEEMIAFSENIAKCSRF